MPYVSRKQESFFHTDTARRKGISAATVKEFDEASKGLRLPERAPTHRERREQMHKRHK